MRLAKDLQREIEALAPVLDAELAGHRDEMIEVLIDPLKLEAYNIAAAELARIVAANNQMIAAGEIDTGAGKFPIRVPGSFDTVRDVYDVPVKVDGERVVTLGDIAEIRRTFEDAEGYARYNGRPTIALQVSKRIGENIIDTVAAVRDTVEQEIAAWPEPLRDAVAIDYSLDQSKQVEDMVSQLEGSVLTAILLVMIVVIAALGPQSALLVGLAVPCSFLLAFALMGALGIAISNMVMFGLILAVGMLVDGAIVVAEFAEKRMAAGVSPKEAYGAAARRMFWPIVSSTATTLCAFLPMLFWPGMPGEFMGLLPVTLIFVLSASLLVALIYLPVVGAIFGGAVVAVGRAVRRLGGRSLIFRGAEPPDAATAIEGERSGEMRPRSGFGAFVHLIVGNPFGPFVALAVAVGAVFGAFALYGANAKGVEFFVKTEPERGIVHVRARGNLSLAEEDRLVRYVEELLLEVDGVSAVFAFSGEGGLVNEGGEGPPDAIGQLQFELSDWRERFGRDDPLYGDEVIASIEAAIAGLPGGVAELALQKEGPQQGKPIQAQLTANSWDALHAAAVALRERFEAEPGLVNIDDTRPLPGIEWRFEVDRAAAGRFGADVEQVGVIMQLVTRGAMLGTHRPNDSDEELDIRVRFPEDDRTLSTLDQLKLRTDAGLAPLSNFVDRSAAPKLASIERRDGERFFLVRADVAPDANANEKIAALSEWIEANADAFPAGVEINFVGDLEEQEESQAFLGQAFIGALGLMFVILLAQFNSIYNSLLVLTAVVMSVGGVLIGMLVMDQTFSIIMTGTGIVALAGIVVNNNIVLIDTYQEYADRMPRLEAIVRTAEDRLRPVLLTTITTIAGLLPMMFATSIDFFDRQIVVGAPTALWWVQLATAVIFGLGFATLLTLIATPAALAARIWIMRGVSAAARGIGIIEDSRGGDEQPAATPAPPFKVAAE